MQQRGRTRINLFELMLRLVAGGQVARVIASRRGFNAGCSFTSVICLRHCGPAAQRSPHTVRLIVQQHAVHSRRTVRVHQQGPGSFAGSAKLPD